MLKQRVSLQARAQSAGRTASRSAGVGALTSQPTTLCASRFMGDQVNSAGGEVILERLPDSWMKVDAFGMPYRCHVKANSGDGNRLCFCCFVLFCDFRVRLGAKINNNLNTHNVPLFWGLLGGQFEYCVILTRQQAARH